MDTNQIAQETNKASRAVGRPKKAKLNAIAKPGKRGRPPGHAAAVAEFTARIINSPSSRKVMDAIVNAALDDEHKNQAAAWKILMDRMVPLSAFEKNASGVKPTININISGVGQPQDVLDIEQSDDEDVI